MKKLAFIIFCVNFLLAQNGVLGSIEIGCKALKNKKTLATYKIQVVAAPTQIYSDPKCTKAIPNKSINSWKYYYVFSVYGEIKTLDKLHKHIAKPISYYIGENSNKKLTQRIGWLKAEDCIGRDALTTKYELYEKVIISEQNGKSGVTAYKDAFLTKENASCPFFSFCYIFTRKKVKINGIEKEVIFVGASSRSTAKNGLLGWVDMEYCQIWNTRLAVWPNKKNYRQRIKLQGTIKMYKEVDEVEISLKPNANISPKTIEHPDTRQPSHNEMRYPVTDFKDVYDENAKFKGRILNVAYLSGNTEKIGKIQDYVQKKIKSLSKLDIVFVCDATGSMAPFAKTISEAIADSFKSQDSFNERYNLLNLEVNIQWGCVLFKDFYGSVFDKFNKDNDFFERKKDKIWNHATFGGGNNNEFVIDIFSYPPSELILHDLKGADRDRFTEYILNLKNISTGGGDIYESVFYGINISIVKSHWRNGQKIVILAGNSGNHLPESNSKENKTKLTKEVIFDLARKNEIQFFGLHAVSQKKLNDISAVIKIAQSKSTRNQASFIQKTRKFRNSIFYQKAMGELKKKGKKAFLAFLQRTKKAYEDLDDQMEFLAQSERYIGDFRKKDLSLFQEKVITKEIQKLWLTSYGEYIGETAKIFFDEEWNEISIVDKNIRFVIKNKKVYKGGLIPLGGSVLHHNDKDGQGRLLELDKWIKSIITFKLKQIGVWRLILADYGNGVPWQEIKEKHGPLVREIEENSGLSIGSKTHNNQASLTSSFSIIEHDLLNRQIDTISKINFSGGYTWSVHPTGNLNQFQEYALMEKEELMLLLAKFSSIKRSLERKLSPKNVAKAWKEIIKKITGENNVEMTLEEAFQKSMGIPLKSKKGSTSKSSVFEKTLDEIKKLDKESLDQWLSKKRSIFAVSLNEIQSMRENDLEVWLFILGEKIKNLMFYIQNQREIKTGNTVKLEKEEHFWLDLHGELYYTWLPLEKLP